MSAPQDDAATKPDISDIEGPKILEEVDRIYWEISRIDYAINQERTTWMRHEEIIHDFIREHGVHAENPEEEDLVEAIAKAQNRVLDLEDQIIEHAEMAKHRLERCILFLDWVIAGQESDN